MAKEQGVIIYVIILPTMHYYKGEIRVKSLKMTPATCAATIVQ